MTYASALKVGTMEVIILTGKPIIRKIPDVKNDPTNAAGAL
jgi:hypothetical protein